MNVPRTAQTDELLETRTCQVNGYRICYRVLGEGHPALLLHGWGASWHYWQWLMPALAQAGYRAFAPDLLGHGDSAKPPLDYGSESYLAFVCELVQVLALEQFILAGHSLGGYIALGLAEERPECIERLVLVSPLYCPDQLQKSLISWILRVSVLGQLVLRLVPLGLMNVAIRFSSLARSDNVPESFLRQAALDYKRATPRIAHHRLGSPDLRRDVSRVATPTLVVWGEQDVLLSPRSFLALVQMLPTGQARPFPGAGHSPLVERPLEFNEVVLRFLENTRG